MGKSDKSGQLNEVLWRQLSATMNTMCINKGVELSDPERPEKDAKRHAKRLESGKNTYGR